MLKNYKNLQIEIYNKWITFGVEVCILVCNKEGPLQWLLLHCYYDLETLKQYLLDLEMDGYKSN